MPAYDRVLTGYSSCTEGRDIGFAGRQDWPVVAHVGARRVPVAPGEREPIERDVIRARRLAYTNRTQRSPCVHLLSAGCPRPWQGGIGTLDDDFLAADARGLPDPHAYDKPWLLASR
jgi:hypothetical protein